MFSAIESLKLYGRDNLVVGFDHDGNVKQIPSMKDSLEIRSSAVYSVNWREV